MRRLIRQLAWQWVLLSALLVGGGATSVWAQSNTFPSSGNVGIGTTNPGYSLDVNGTTRLMRRVYTEGALATYAGQVWTTSSAVPLVFGINEVEKMRLDTSGNVGIGTTTPAAKLHVAGDAQVDGNLAAKYQDVAEWVKTPDPLPPGTVVVVNPHERNQILLASQSYDTRVAGVVSDRPGLLLGEAGEGKVKVAQSGRVKVKVDATYGPIAAGDLLVTSPTPGHAMRSSPVRLGDTLIHRPGTLLGKALEPLEEGQNEILVLLTLQ